MSDAPPSESPERLTSESLRDGRYRVLGVLGSGAQGETLEAEDQTTGARVAIKRFHVRGAKSWKDVELAEREARVLSQLSHPNLPRYIEHFEENGALYLVIEKIEGRTLGELRRAKLGLTQRQLLRFLREAGETLRYLHERAPPLIHRDIKPSNVILKADGSFVLVDFGSVRDRLRPEGGSTVVGTFGYMAPEQFQGRSLPASDVYGVAATAIACLTGEEPESLPHRGLGVDVARALGAGAPRPLVALLSELLEPDPDRRPADLSRAVARYFGPEPARAGSEPPSRPERHERSRRHAASELPRARHAWRSAPAAPLVLIVVLVGLMLARFATFGLFRVLLPLMLGLLALFFGGGLRRAAERMAEIGELGEAALRRAATSVQSTLRATNKRRPRQRFRVEDEAELEAELDRETPRSRRARRS